MMFGQENFVRKLYKRRWLILIALTLSECLYAVAYACFGQVNDFYVAFFKVTYAQVDWATLTHNVSPFVVLLPVLWMIHHGKFGFRNVVIFATVCLSLSFLCSAVSLVSDKLFALVIAGQMFDGITATLLIATPPTFAVTWFPEEEIGSAIAINIVGLYLGISLGTTLPALAIKKQTNLTSDTANVNHTLHVRQFLTILNSVCLTLSLSVVLMFVFLVTDIPPTPPTTAQQVKSVQKEKKKKLGFCQALKQLLFDKTYLLACIVFGITTQLVTLEYIMMSEMMRELVEKDLLSINADRFGGYLLAVYSVGAVVGILATGKIMDFCKHYSILSNIGSVLFFISTLAFILAFWYANLPGLFVSNFINGFGSKGLMVVLYEIATQHTYPMDETFVSTLLTICRGPVGVFTGEIGRVLFNSFGSLSVLVFQSTAAFLTTVMTAFLSPKCLRLAVSTNVVDYVPENNSESESLLQSEH